MAKRENISSGAKWEDVVGYSRAVRVGDLIEISGTVALKDGVLVGEGDAYLQTKRIIEIAKETLSKAGARLEDVIRTRIYVTDISQWEAVGRAHGEIFASIKPATSMVEVSRLIDPGFLVEIEFTAMLQ
ncbi:RidA family protein [Fulvivirga sp. RKSG066]|uniref:RidA family protein n=1 Tax=Fulvivirga aurantia TaxID=2529383 RepID=UPI0012BB8693|nr:RidA family protein [Fulvivirga aurantia]MTI22640.1 RidA family protein [Fulvivirga aurantia]